MIIRIIIFVIIFSILFSFTCEEVFAAPSFPEQFLDTGTAAYYPENYFADDSDALNLEEVFYSSDSKTLEATLILHGNSGFEKGNIISYGMLIDTDTDFETGKGGFDVRYKVQWENGTWFEMYEKISSSGIIKNISEPQQIDNVFTPDIETNGQHRASVDLKLDLEKIGKLDTYSIVFFSEGKLIGKTPLIQDVFSRVIIPPLTFEVHTDPFPLSFESGTKKDVHIFIDSTFTENAEIYYNIRSNSDNVIIEEVSDNSIFLQNGKAEIPILVQDIPHEDTQTHELIVDLSPWYPVNKETEGVERGGEIFESYYYRNQQYTESVRLLWTSLPKPQIDWEFYIAIVGISVAITSVLLSNHQTRKSNKISQNSFDLLRKSTEADLLLRLNESIYRSDEGKKIIEAIRLKQNILEKNDGLVNERDLENFLNEVETVAILIKQGTLTSTMAEQSFGWVIQLIKENKEVMDYIKQAQEKYGDVAWIEITRYNV